MSIKAIETRYAGCRFRSRLEARWAVFFDHLGIKWEYEPEGFDLPSGPYLPDFLLPDLDVCRVGNPGTWFEIKPDKLDLNGDARWYELSDATGRSITVARGLPTDNEVLLGVPEYRLQTAWGRACIARGLDFAMCPDCGRVGLVRGGIGSHVCPPGRHGHLPDVEVAKRQQLFRRVVRSCYGAARSARFEHGEVG